MTEVGKFALLLDALLREVAEAHRSLLISSHGGSDSLLFVLDGVH